jgi:hypothetical protein
MQFRSIYLIVRQDASAGVSDLAHQGSLLPWQDPWEVHVALIYQLIFLVKFMFFDMI